MTGWGLAAQEADGEKGAIVLHTCPALTTKKKGTREAMSSGGQSPVCGYGEQGHHRMTGVIAGNEGGTVSACCLLTAW